MKKSLLFFVLLPLSLLAQVGIGTSGTCYYGKTPLCSDTQTITASGGAVRIESNGGLSVSFDYTIPGTPDTVSAVVAGCGASGTCETLDTYTTVANAVRAIVPQKTYSYYTVTGSWTGGSGVSIKVTTTMTTALAYPGVTSNGNGLDVAGTIKVGTTVVAGQGANYNSAYKLSVNGQSLFDGFYPIIIDPSTSHIYGAAGQSVGFGGNGHYQVYSGCGGVVTGICAGVHIGTQMTLAGPDFSTWIGANPDNVYASYQTGTTLGVWDERAGGITKFAIREGLGQVANPSFALYANDGTTKRVWMTSDGGGAVYANQFNTPNGSISFSGSGLQIWNTNAGAVHLFQVAGSGIVAINASSIYPNGDNAIDVGQAAQAFKAVYTHNLQLVTLAAPTCDATHRGQFNYVAGAAGAKDTVQVCTKDAADAYAWRTIY